MCNDLIETICKTATSIEGDASHLKVRRELIGRLRSFSPAPSQVLSGCAVRAAAQQQRIENDRHYLVAIKGRLEALYKRTKAPNIREQISDEVDWLDEQLGIRQ